MGAYTYYPPEINLLICNSVVPRSHPDTRSKFHYGRGYLN